MRSGVEIDLSRPVTLRDLPEILGGIWSWWAGEIVALLPISWRALVQTKDRLCVHLSRGHAHPSASETGARAAIIVTGETGLRESQLPVDVWLHPDLILRRDIELPNLTSRQIRSAVSYQIDELTPFTKDEAHFDVRVKSRDVHSQRILVEIAILPVNVWKQCLNASGLERARLGRIGVKMPGDADASFQFSLSPVAGANRLRFGPVLIWTALIAAGIGAVMWSWRSAAEREQEMLVRQIRDLRLRAEAAMALDNRIRSIESPLNAMSADTSDLDPLRALFVLARLTPESVTLTKVELEADEMRLSGSALNAAAFVQGLGGSKELEKVKFASPVTADAAGGVERFSITAAFVGSKK